MERWFWPGTSAAAAQMLATLTQWSKSGELPGSPTSPPPQIAGAVLPRIGFDAVWKSMRVPCLVSLCAGWFVMQIPSLEIEGLLTPFAAPLVTGAMILFIFAPHLEWGPAPQPPPLPEVE